MVLYSMFTNFCSVHKILLSRVHSFQTCCQMHLFSFLLSILKTYPYVFVIELSLFLQCASVFY